MLMVFVDYRVNKCIISIYVLTSRTPVTIYSVVLTDFTLSPPTTVKDWFVFRWAILPATARACWNTTPDRELTQRTINRPVTYAKVQHTQEKHWKLLRIYAVWSRPIVTVSLSSNPTCVELNANITSLHRASPESMAHQRNRNAQLHIYTLLKDITCKTSGRSLVTVLLCN